MLDMLYKMGSNFFTYFALILAYIKIGCCAECETDLYCMKTTTNAAHCCRDLAANSNLSCYVSSCFGHFCSDDKECSEGCCRSNKCSNCIKCVNNADCNKEKVCCGKHALSEHGECRSDCVGSECRLKKDCSSSTLCCFSKKCVGCLDHRDDFIFAVSAGTACLLLLVLICICVLSRYKLKSRRIAPRNIAMNGTVLTMPTTYPCTNNRTTSSSRQE